MNRGASLSEDGVYRFELWRRWEEGPEVLIIGLNPSTADASHDDPTLRRCVGFAQRWGFGGLRLVNLFALRATDPRLLKTADDPVGPGNLERVVEIAARAPRVLAAWGNHGALFGQDRKLRSQLPEDTVCLGLTARGQPRHPLYVPYDAPVVDLPRPPGELHVAPSPPGSRGHSGLPRPRTPQQ